MSIVGSQTVSLDSGNRTYGSPDDATFAIDSDLIRAYDKEHIRVKLQDFCVRNAAYDVAKGMNDQFVIQPAGYNPVTNVIIPPNVGFTISYGSPDAYYPSVRVTIPGFGYLSNGQIASQIQTALTNKISGSSWTVKWQNWSNPSSTTGRKFGIVLNTAGANFTLAFDPDYNIGILRTKMGFLGNNYPSGGGAASNAYYAEQSDLPNEKVPSCYITLPQGFYDADRLVTVLTGIYPFSGGSPVGDSSINTDPWTVSTDSVTNSLTMTAPSTFPTNVTLNFTDTYLPANLTTNTLMGFSGTQYGPVGANGSFSSDEETQLTRVSNLIIHTDIPPRKANQILDNFSTVQAINQLPFVKQSNVLARLPIDVPQGALISYRDLNDDFVYNIAPDRLQSLRIYLTDQYNQKIPQTPDATFNCVLRFDYFAE